MRSEGRKENGFMFEKFGEFDSVEELNAAAEGLLKEGDTASLMELAKENGIDEEDAADYRDGYAASLATVTMAAFGRLKVLEKNEVEKIKNPIEQMAMRVIITMLKGMCTDETMAAAVMQKGKRISEIFKAMKNEAEKHKDENVGISCGTDRELCEIIRAYYTQSDSRFKEKIKSLY